MSSEAFNKGYFAAREGQGNNNPYGIRKDKESHLAYIAGYKAGLEGNDMADKQHPQKMNELAIIQAENFSTGTVKRPNAVNLSALASGQPIESLLPLFKFSGYSLRIAKYDPETITVLVFDKTDTDKDTKQKTVTDIRKIVTLTLDSFKAWQADTLFSSTQAAKLALTCAKKLADYPLLALADSGLYPQDRIVPVLSAVLSAKYDLKSTDADNTATAIMAYVVDRPALATSPLTKILSYVETEAIAALRYKEFKAKQDKKSLAATTNDQF